ncbi:MAG: diaminopimelate decarboxylase [Planctomycetaceae bacterium]|nr:diaminopimelate decarboxylase [Planctomycetaceae bacterium]
MSAFLTTEQVLALQDQYGTPVYVYDQRTLQQQAASVLSFPHAFGLTARYAMKACPSSAVLRILHNAGLHIDASSGYEALRAIRAGVPAAHIQLTAQQLAHNFAELVGQGVLFNACSLSQLDAFGRLFPGRELSVRINPGLGSGHNNRTNTGGPSSSFGIWHEHLDQVFAIARQHGLRLTGMHTHIGSGSDPNVWVHCSSLALSVAARMPDVTRLSLGGGFKVGRMPGEVSTDVQAVGKSILPAFEQFAQEHGRKLHLEIEPGTMLVANAGAVIATVIDVVDTGSQGRRFIKVDSGMTELLRPSLYGAQHPIDLVPRGEPTGHEYDYVIAGHCCESGDILTPEPGNPEGLLPRRLPEARLGDPLVIGGAGAYCAGMASKNYNSFPEAPEVLLRTDGATTLIRRRQTLDQVLENELDLRAGDS